MKCPICATKISDGLEACRSCSDAMGLKRDNLEEIIGRHREWAINSLLRIDARLDFLKAKVLNFDKEIRSLESQKLKLFKKLGSSCKNQEVKNED